MKEANLDLFLKREVMSNLCEISYKHIGMLAKEC